MITGVSLPDSGVRSRKRTFVRILQSALALGSAERRVAGEETIGAEHETHTLTVHDRVLFGMGEMGEGNRVPLVVSCARPYVGE